MRHVSLAALITLSAMVSPGAPLSAQGGGQSRVTGAITIALDARETPR